MALSQTLMVPQFMKTDSEFPRFLKRTASALLSAWLLWSGSAEVVFASESESAGLTDNGGGEDALPFSDVPGDAWFYSDVLSAFSLGLVNGKSAKVFAPYDGILLSEAVKLASCLNERFLTGTVTLGNGQGVWYEPYVAYAEEHGITDGGEVWERQALRGEVMELFARAVPLDPVNDIPDGSIPDVPMDHPHADAIYALYRAGVIQGTDADSHLCEPDVWVTRAEIAATMTRLTDPAARLVFSIQTDEPSQTEEPAEVDPAREEQQVREEDSGGFSESAVMTYSDLTLSWAAIYETRFGPGASDEPLLTDAEIDAYNAKMAAGCPTMADLCGCPDTLPGPDVIALIGRYALPVGYDYDRDGNYIGEDERVRILSNRNLESIGETVEIRRAVVTSRADMKSFPMEDGFYPYGNPGFNQAQETEVPTGTPVIVLHRSSDGAYLFVRTYHYVGWIPARCAAFCDRDTFERFVRRDPETGVTVTAPWIYANGARLDMGTWLPCLGGTADGYEVLLPIRGTDGSYAEIAVNIGADSAVRGRLPYTMKNVYEQAFRWLGTTYGWGGANGGVDCSGFLCAVFRSFGILIPRNSSEQRQYGGAVTNIAPLGASDRLELFASSRFPVAIHRSGHVMLYLGESNGQLWIVHAHSIGQPVSIASLDPWSAMLSMVELKP